MKHYLLEKTNYSQEILKAAGKSGKRSRVDSSWKSWGKAALGEGQLALSDLTLL